MNLNERFELRVQRKLLSSWYRVLPRGQGAPLLRTFMAQVVDLLVNDRRHLIPLLRGEWQITFNDGEK